MDLKRLLRRWTWICLCGFALTSSWTSPCVPASNLLSGLPRIVDGDTAEIAGVKVRLSGIDAPETDQICLDASSQSWNCGIESRDQLARYSAGRTWQCQLTGTDRYHRALGKCEVAGDDLQAWMVRNGWALSFTRYSRIYDPEENEARLAKRGLWAGAFIAPWDWRSRTAATTILGALSVPVSAQKKLVSPQLAETAPSAACAIKGNINRTGECIFHVPGSRYYNLVKMDLSKGKRWFCSPVEAEAAGCRPPK